MFKRLIQRLKILSLFDIFVCISIIAFTVFIVKFFGQKTEWKTVKIEVINRSWADNYNPYGYRTPFWLSEKLKIGQKEYNKSGKLIAEVLNIENYERGSEEAEVYLTVKLKTNLQKRLRQNYFKEKPLDLGSAIELSLDQNTVYGQVIDTDAPVNGYPQKKFIITTRGRGIDKYIIDHTKIGDVMKNRYNNTTVATILDFHTEKTTVAYVNQINNNSGALGFKINEDTKDLIVKFEIITEQIDGRWYFAGHQQVKVGNGIYFYGQNINLLLGIEDVQEL